MKNYEPELKNPLITANIKKNKNKKIKIKILLKNGAV